MHIPRLLLLSLLISVCAAPVAAQSSSDKNPSQPLSTTPQSAQASIRVDQLQLRRLLFHPRLSRHSRRSRVRLDETCGVFHVSTRCSVSCERRR